MAKHADSNTSKKVVLIIVTMASFLAPFSSSSVNIALPSIGREFAMDAIYLSWVATAYFLAAVVFMVPMGRIADIVGRKKIFTLGILIYTVASLLLATATSGPMLIAFRALQGIGSATIFGTRIAILTSVYPAAERGKALGINVASVYLGVSLGPVLGGFLTHNFGWRSIFVVTVLLGLTISAFVFWKLKGEWAEARGEKFDITGSIIYGLALIAAMYGFSLLPGLSGIWLVLAGIVGLLVFIRWEMKVKSPVLNISLFRNNRTFVLSNVAMLINFSAIFAVGFLLSLYLQYTKGFSPQSAGLIMVAQPAVQVMIAPFAGRLSDRIEPRIIASIGMTLTTMGLVTLVFINQNTPIGFIIVSLLLLGSGLALFSSPNTNAIISSVEKRFYGVASGIMGTMRLAGQVLSMGMAMMILAIFVGRVQITPEYYPLFIRSLQVLFAIFAVLCFGGIFASLARGKIR